MRWKLSQREYTVSWVHPLKLCTAQYQLVNGKLQGKTTSLHHHHTPECFSHLEKSTARIILDDGHDAPLQNGCLIYPEGVCVLGKERQGWALFSCFMALPQTCFGPLMVTAQSFRGGKEEIQKEEIKMLLIWASSHFSSPARPWW